MAKWQVYGNRNGNLTFSYLNTATKQVHVCGELRADTPKGMVVDWVMQQGDPNPGDVICFDDGTALFIHSTQDERIVQRKRYLRLFAPDLEAT